MSRILAGGLAFGLIGTAGLVAGMSGCPEGVSEAACLHAEIGPPVPVPGLEETDFTEAELLAKHGPLKATNPDHSRSVATVQEAQALLGKSFTAVGGAMRTVSGSLDGRIVYLMAGHGWSYDSPGVWYTQRPRLLEMIEDMGNHDQAAIMAEYLLNAGATVVPLRPIGHQRHEVVIDNDDAQVTFAGTWINSTATNFYGSTGDVPYRYANTVVGAPTATATYNASSLIPVEGFYPVYVWTRAGSDRINQEYIIGHSGGTVSRRINHRRVGGGWIYVGTFHFAPGGQAYVQITNARESGDPGTYTFADAVRFGNGMGDSRVEGEASGHPREEENGRYWLAESRGIGSGLALSDSVSSPPRLARYMNREAEGANTERIYFSFHSNAGSGTSRGADGLFNSDASGGYTTNPANANSQTTPNGTILAQYAGTKTNVNMRSITTAAGNPFEHVWGRLGTGTNLYGSGGSNINAFGEISVTNLGTEMAATIIEVAFHDNQLDAELLRDPKVRDAIARANLHAIVDFFNTVASGPTTYLPEPPERPRVITNASGQATLHWTAPVAGGTLGAGGDAPTGYVVYVSENGRGFAVHQTIAGGAVTSLDVTSAVPAGQTRYFRVAATNAGGESFPSRVVALHRQAAKSKALIVDGFDRFERRLNHRQTEAAYLGSPTAGGGTFDRVIPRFNNSFDYVVELGSALAAAGVTFDSCHNSAVAAGQVALTGYSHVFYILGRESTADVTFSAAEQTAIEAFVAAGGNLFASGTEIGWDLGRTAASAANKAFLQNTLRIAPFTTNNPQDDALTFTVQGSAGGIFAGIGPFTFSDGSDPNGKYRGAFPDVLNPSGANTTSDLTYVGGTGGSAAVVYDGSTQNRGKVVVFGFPFEIVNSATTRNQLMAATVTFFEATTNAVDCWRIY